MSIRGWTVLSVGFALVVAIILAGCAQPTPNPVSGGDATAGQATFNQRCSACHTASSLAGRQALIVNNLASVNIAMAGITLTDTEVANLQAFIATQ